MQSYVRLFWVSNQTAERCVQLAASKTRKSTTNEEQFLAILATIREQRQTLIDLSRKALKVAQKNKS